MQIYQGYLGSESRISLSITGIWVVAIAPLSLITVCLVKPFSSFDTNGLQHPQQTYFLHLGDRDDCLRDIFVRGKYRDVILPMFVLRRLDCLLEITKDKVMEEVLWQREEADMVVLDPDGLRDVSGYVFCNISDWKLKKIVNTAANNSQIIEANFKAYLDGFSDDVKEIIEKFDLRNQIRKMSQSDVLLGVLEKFTSPDINLSPHDVTDRHWSANGG